jgi:hypothetical protein
VAAFGGLQIGMTVKPLLPFNSLDQNFDILVTFHHLGLNFLNEILRLMC